VALLFDFFDEWHEQVPLEAVKIQVIRRPIAGAEHNYSIRIELLE